MSYFGRDTVTLYNGYEGLKTQFYPTVFYNVDMQNDFNAHAARTGIDSADRSVLLIDTKDFPKPYLPYEEWIRQLNDEMGNTFTVNIKGLSEGARDFFLKGVHEEILDVRSAQSLRQQANSVFTVQRFGDYLEYGHIEIGGG